MILPYSIGISLVILLFASYIIHVIRYLILYLFHIELIISSYEDRKDLNFKFGKGRLVMKENLKNSLVNMLKS